MGPDDVAMGLSPLYAWGTVALSGLSLGLALAYLGRVVGAYRRYRDERAAVSMVKGVGLLVMAAGLMVSSLGLVLGHDGATLATAGLSLARGALVVLLATLVLAGVRPGGE